MKKIFYTLVLSAFTVGFFTACSEDEGTNPGSDPRPLATMYTYMVSPADGYNPDNDIALRFAVNQQTKELYFLVEKTDAYEKNLKELGETGYAEYIKKNGYKFTDLSEAYVDTTIVGLFGSYTITALAVNGGQNVMAKTEFVGLDWEDLVEGQYTFGIENITQIIQSPKSGVILQVCTTDAKLFRYKDLFGTGYSMKFRTSNVSGKDDEGEPFVYTRVEPQMTGLVFSTYGGVNVRDIGYWQGDDAFVFELGYGGVMYDDGYGIQFVQYYVSTDNLGYGQDIFTPTKALKKINEGESLIELPK